MGEATVTIYPQEDDEPGGSWWDREGATLGTAVADDNLKLTTLRATGLLAGLSRVGNIYDALDARSADYAVFLPMFEGPGSPELQEELAAYSSQAVLVDRVWLAPTWRGHGVGRLLTARLLGWVCPDPMAVSQEMAKARRTWKSVGFWPFGKDIMAMDPAMAGPRRGGEQARPQALRAPVARQPPQQPRVPAPGWRPGYSEAVPPPGTRCRRRPSPG